MKRHLFYTFLCIFIATSAVTLLGITGVVHIVDGYLTPLVSAFLTQLAAAVIAVFRAAKFFENEFQESKEVAKAIATANAKHRQEIFQITKLYSEGKGLLIPRSILEEDERKQKEKQKAHHDG